jgi:asparagine synthetase A
MNWLKNKLGITKYYYVSYLADSENGFTFGRVTVEQIYGGFKLYLFEEAMKKKFNFKVCVPIRVQEISKKEYSNF